METAEASATEAPTEVLTQTDVEPPSIEEQIKDLEAKLDDLESQRVKSVVEELAFEPEALAAVAKSRAKERFPRALREVEKRMKQLAWSGERSALLEPASNIFNDQLVKALTENGFRAKVVSLGAGAGFKISVSW